MPFSEKLAKMRNDRGLTQQQMAAMIGVGIAQIRRYEKGNSSPTLEVIMTIIDSMIIKNRLEEVLPGHSDTAWTNQMRKVVKKFRDNAKDYSEDEINSIVDEAVQSVRAEETSGDKIGA